MGLLLMGRVSLENLLYIIINALLITIELFISIFDNLGFHDGNKIRQPTTILPNIIKNPNKNPIKTKQAASQRPTPGRIQQKECIDGNKYLIIVPKYICI